MAAAIAVSACSGDDEATVTTEWPQVDFETYEAGVFAFADCMRAAGTPLVDLELDTTAQRYRWLVPDAAVRSGIEARCLEPFDPIDVAWQTRPGRPLSSTEQMIFDAAAACIAAEGVDVSGADSLGELWARTGNDADAQQCMSAEQLLNPTTTTGG